MLLFFAVRWFNRRYRRLLSAPTETYFGDDGLFCNGGYYNQWTFSGSYMKEVDARLF